MKIEFKKYNGEAVLHSPLKNFEIDRQAMESRLDPLTGQATVVRTGRKFWQHQYTTDEKLLADIAAQTREKCFFCPERVSTYTPRYPEEFIEGGKIFAGEAVLFPNLFAQKEDSAVAVISPQRHFIPLDQFKPELLLNAFKACAKFIHRLHEAKGSRYCHIGFNYMFPAGSSIPHPHLQVMGSPLPDFLLTNLLRGSEAYFGRNKCCYWDDLVAAEKGNGERYIGRLGNVEWLTPFAPSREDEVHGLTDKSNLLEFSDEDWSSLAEGVSRVFRFYKASGLSSCNFAIYSAGLGQKLEHFRAGIRIVSRSSVKPQPINDVWFSQNILYDGLVTEPPEETAGQLRPYFVP